ncbi:MAG: glycoside hydrolase family 28 protein [Bacteroidota bacterium]|nr:glycoside hydrolase family 28 protein [Bacteroidota bacterium]
MTQKKLIYGLLLIFIILATVNINAQIPDRTIGFSWENLPTAKTPVFKKDTVNIVKFGAISDGISLNTNSINNAVAECSKNGGGVVLVPQGLWLTGPVVLQNNVNLHIAKKALLLFTGDFEQYKLLEGSYEGKPSFRNQSPISGTNLENIAITGQGIIDGNGDFWRSVNKGQLTESEWKKKITSGGIVSEDGSRWFPSEKYMKGHLTPNAAQVVPGKTAKDYEEIKDFLRPNLLVLTQCKRVLLEGVTFQNSPAWCLHPLMCEDLTLMNVNVKNPEYAQNGDGIDVESCKNVLIDGCTFDVGDDAICIKSGKDKFGRERGIPSENMVIRNNMVYKGHGAFVVGSEMSGGARNIFVSDCTFMGTDKGIRFKTARGRGGIVENIFIKNILMKDIQSEAIYFDMYYFTKPPVPGEKVVVPEVSEETPQFQKIQISNVVCNGADKGIFIRGLPEMAVKNISITNSVISARIGVELIEAENITLKNIRLVTKETKPVIAIENSSSLTIDSLKYNKNTDLLFKVSGNRSGNIDVFNTNVSNTNKSLELGADVLVGAIRIN